MTIRVLHSGYGKTRFESKLKGRKVKPRRIPRSVEQLPVFVKPKKPGAGRLRHWTESHPKVMKEIKRFAKDVLGFKRAYMEYNPSLTGNVDWVVIDKGQKPYRCAAFEVKAAKPYKLDKSAYKKRGARGPAKRPGTFEINPMQHEDTTAAAGVCSLYYVLVPIEQTRRPLKRRVKGQPPKETVRRVSFCNIPMIEWALDSKLAKRRAIHRDLALACPTVDEIVWQKIGD